ncbi:MAG: hypothetical protein PHP01_05475 [Phycisphaerae bacterium]|nr:hypothetical protein [Phycisphaerae bacterium]
MECNAIIRRAILFLLIVVFVFSFMVIGCRKAGPEGETASAASSDDTEKKSQAVSKGLGDIVSKGRSWGPILMEFYGKAMPDFKVTDLTG